MDKIIKCSIYPKTTRFGKNEKKIVLTEKIDGSNLTFFKFENELYIAQRNNIYKFKDFEENKDVFKGIMYKGLTPFLEQFGNDLEEKLYDGSAICGEWLGQGKIKYSNRFNTRFLLFAKARVIETNNGFSLQNIVYNLDLIHWVVGETLPDYLDTVPFVCELDHYPNLEELDKIYLEYSEKQDSNIEGFVINNCNQIEKYVRFKNGVLEPHVCR